MDKLKKCPFCGGNANIIKYTPDDNTTVFSVECTGCCVSLDYFDTEEEAKQTWNTRYHETGD